MFIQTLKDIAKIQGNVGGYNMNYEEVKQLWRKTWEEEYIYLYFDSFKKTDQRKNIMEPKAIMLTLINYWIKK